MNKIVSTIVNPSGSNVHSCALKGCFQVANNTIFGLIHDGYWIDDPEKGQFLPICLKCASKAGYIQTDSLVGSKIGFIAESFSGSLWLHDNLISITMLNVTEKHKTKEEEMYHTLFMRILENGYSLQLMNASLTMEKAAAQIGYTRKTAFDTIYKVPYNYIEMK